MGKGQKYPFKLDKGHKSGRKLFGVVLKCLTKSFDSYLLNYSFKINLNTFKTEAKIYPPPDIGGAKGQNTAQESIRHFVKQFITFNCGHGDVVVNTAPVILVGGHNDAGLKASPKPNSDVGFFKNKRSFYHIESKRDPLQSNCGLNQSNHAESQAKITLSASMALRFNGRSCG